MPSIAYSLHKKEKALGELRHKLKEVLVSVLPIVAVVLISGIFVMPLDSMSLARFLIGTLFISMGLVVFLFGVDTGISPIGALIGSRITYSNSISEVLLSGLVLGFFISVAEPDLHVLAGQVGAVTGNVLSKVALVSFVSIGVSVLLSSGLFRIIKGIALNRMLTVLYGLIFILCIFVPGEFLAIAFDASGATTGAMTVPFILALARGVSAMKKDSLASEEDSFGLVAIASTGAILAVLFTGLFFGELDSASAINSVKAQSSILGPFIGKMPAIALEVLVAMLPIMTLFLILRRQASTISGKSASRMLRGLGFTLVGLVLFLTGVNAGFMDAGISIGRGIALSGNSAAAIVMGFILGFVTVMAEPAVYALTHQIQEVTSGYVKRATVLGALALGVGTAVALSIVRILVPGIQIWHYLLPGYLLSIGLSFIVPKLFVGMAFDAGGVASGPMSVTFILAFTNGVADGVEQASVLIDGFGMIAMIALMPILAIELLGLAYRLSTGRRR